MKKYPFFYILFFILTVAFFSGCAKAVRYSPEEVKDFTPEMQEHIRKGEVITGMTTHQVRYSWGAPDEVKVLAPLEDGKAREEWIYKRLGVFRTRLIFTGSKLTELISTEPGIAK